MSNQQFDKIINRVGTYSTQWDYVEDRFGEKDLLPFTISDMDFAIPENVSHELHARLKHPVFGYTRWNHSDYKGAIISWFKNRFESEVEEDWISYSPSVIYSVSRLIELKSEENEGIVTQTPAYDAFFKTIEGSNRKVVENALIYKDGQYILDWKDLEYKLSQPENTVLLLCNPHNPTGLVWSEEDLTRIITLCQTYNVFIISDDIHMDVTRANKKYQPITHYVETYDQIALCSSTSKSFNVPGLGGSYVFIPDKVLYEEFQYLLKNRDGLSSANILGMVATMAAYTEEGASWIDELNDYVDQNLKFVESYLNQYLPKLKYKVADSTYLAWIDIQDLPYSMEELQKALVEEGKVAIMAGTIYGGNGEHFLRFNVGCPRSKVEQGLKKLNEAINFLNTKK